ncbi:hypothetical protein [Microcella sp.]|uniref:hypothetical protein n=1 Tax=Microcella sp. TaxID=1913979 RepID=UPI003918FDE9
MRTGRTGCAASWRLFIKISGIAVTLFGGLAAISLVAPEGTLAGRWGVPGATAFIACGSVVIAIAYWLFRPGSQYLNRLADLEDQLRAVCGHESILFAGNIRPSDSELAERMTSLRFGRQAIWSIAVGPLGVAIGRPGKHPRVALLTGEGRDVSFSVGGPGGWPLRPRQREHPKLAIRVRAKEDNLVLAVAWLSDPDLPTSYRDEASIAQLAEQLTTVRESR